QIIQIPPTPPHQFRPDLPPPAEATLLRALAKRPSDRFTSAGELANAFTLGLRGQWAPGLYAPATLAPFVPQPTAITPLASPYAPPATATPPPSAYASQTPPVAYTPPGVYTPQMPPGVYTPPGVYAPPLTQRKPRSGMRGLAVTSIGILALVSIIGTLLV